MANFTASIDDQQERHYIGNLLVDEEVFGQTTNNTFANSSAHQPSGPSILTGSGPLGPSPNQNFWPEPPPPYSPYSCGPTHLPSFERHPPSFFVQPVDGNVYTPTATAVTRTDFYQAPFSSTGEWEGTPGRGINPYVPIGSPLPYPPQTGIMIVKPMMPPQGSVSPMQHHINNIYHHHQQHRLVRGTQYAMTSAMGQADRVPLSIPLFAPDYSSLPPPNPQAPVLPRCDQKVAPKSFSVPFVHVPPNDTSSTLPPGKSYRDAASKVFASPECCAESPASSYVSVVRQPSLNLTGDNENSEKSVVSYVSTDFVRNSSHSGNGGHDNNEFKDIDKRTCSNEKFPESVSVPEAVKSVSRSRSDESEFQKITHKKSRGGRNKKKEKRIFGEEGNGAVVDTPSRFSVLQSLNSQVSGSHMKHTILRQAASNPEHKSEVDEDASKESRRDDNNRSGSKGVSELQNGLSESRKKNEVGKSRDDYVQRSCM
ncbi:hypothetical protein AB6A40_009320 [Gnathostoma spinigerum]|uniref:Uncharacterized protein n=1 Tax=Gnathostoma spinigerum TaxID=75299 RepID=A0ABD6ERZ5_9BILA